MPRCLRPRSGSSPPLRMPTGTSIFSSPAVGNTKKGCVRGRNWSSMLERLQRPDRKQFVQQRFKEHRNEPTYFSASCADLVSTKSIDSRWGDGPSSIRGEKEESAERGSGRESRTSFYPSRSECKSNASFYLFDWLLTLRKGRRPIRENNPNIHVPKLEMSLG
jgi:hypothetical protein